MQSEKCLSLMSNEVMGEAMEIPVYLFTGFLESGKTSFIQEALEGEDFNSG